MDKELLREELLRKRDAIIPHEWNEKSNIISKTILESDLYKQCDKLFLYADFHGEVGTITVIEDALINNKEVYLPKVLENFDEARMDFFRIVSTFELVDGYKGILEPLNDSSLRFDYESNKNDKLLMFVPGVVFDKNNNRMGYGKGYYDNYLSDKPNIMKIGIAFEMQVVDEIPVSENDIKMDYILTENSTVSDLNKFNF